MFKTFYKADPRLTNLSLREKEVMTLQGSRQTFGPSLRKLFYSHRQVYIFTGHKQL